jgi:hypothetical protein
VAEIAVEQMRLNGGLKVRDLGFKPDRKPGMSQP